MLSQLYVFRLILMQEKFAGLAKMLQNNLVYKAIVPKFKEKGISK